MSTVLSIGENEGSSLISPTPPQRQLPEVFSLSDLRRVILKRYLAILVCTAVLLSSAVVYSLLKKPRYEATAHIAINFDDSTDEEGDNHSPSASTSDMQTRLETQIRILQSDTLAAAVIQQLHLDANPDFSKPDPKHAFMGDPERRMQLIKAFQSALHVAVMPKSELIEIRFRSRSPQVAKDSVNTLVSAFVERNYKVKFEATMQAEDWLQKQLDEIKANVKDDQERVAEFEKEHGVLFSARPRSESGQENQNSTISKLDELGNMLTEAEGQRIVKEANWRLAEQGNPELITSAAPDATLQALRTQEGELRNQYALLSAQFGNSYPKVKEQKAQLQDLEERINSEVANVGLRFKNDFLAARQTEGKLRAKVEEQKKEAYQLNESAVQYTILQREFDSSSDLYDSLLKKLKEAGIAAGLRSTKVTVVDSASLPLKPVEPNIPLNLALGLGGGLVFGLASAFIIENLDNSLRTIEEVESYSGLPPLAIIPTYKENSEARGRVLGMNSKGLKTAADAITLSLPKSQAAEAYRTLRTSLQLSSFSGPVKTVVITSSVLGEGKTCTSVNTAIVLAQNGARVLLVDADLRRPNVHVRFGLANKSGLTTVLAGVEDFRNVVVPHPELSNLTILSSGPSVPFPAEMLGSSHMSALLAVWKKEFDYVILDTPPVLPVTDAIVLGAQADACILVLRWGRIARQPLQRCCGILHRARARIAGVVLNAVNINALDYNYYGGGKYNGYYHNGSGN